MRILWRSSLQLCIPLLKLSPSSFSIHWCVLAELMITLMVAKLWFSDFFTLSPFIHWHLTPRKSFFSFMFRYSFIYLYHYGPMHFCLDAQIVQKLARNPFTLVSVSLIFLAMFLWAFSYFLAWRYSRLTLYFPCPSSGSSLSPRSPVVPFSGEWLFRNWDLSVRCTHCFMPRSLSHSLSLLLYVSI